MLADFSEPRRVPRRVIFGLPFFRLPPQFTEMLRNTYDGRTEALIGKVT